uniref:NADH-ubiquinone oxidoreductase chain 2 n=1 Tax=Campellolebias dorsimaculatus TaxID=60339 RepID=Q9TD58_9TELE|nr:NADH dehydrogenase subunit II [Campellolebias dorsimaculatus]
MNPYVLIMMLSLMILGTLITLTSSHWLLAWMGLEINTFAIVPIMIQDKHPRAMEATLKYFIVQSTAAITLLFATASNAWLSGQWEIQYMMHPLFLTISIFALTLKLGLAPTHSWFPEVLQGLNFLMGLTLATWQKFAPFALLMQISYTSPLLCTILGLTSILVAGWGGLNQTQLRKIFAYSSIAHLGWAFLVIQYCAPLALMTFFIYTIMAAPIFMSLHHLQTKNMNALLISWSKYPIMYLILPFSLLSMAGLPPLTGFLPKWLVLEELTKQSLMCMAIVTSLSMLLNLYYYLLLSYNMALITPPGNTPATLTHYLLNPQSFFFLTTIMPFSLCLYPILPSLATFFML